MSKQFLSQVSLVVADYDEAINFYVNKLGFSLLEDTPRGLGKRWIRVAPAGAQTSIVLMKGDVGPGSVIGCQAGQKVFMFLNTSDFWDDYNRMRNHGVEFLEQPRVEAYGTVAVFKDVYGNKWDLIQTND